MPLRAKSVPGYIPGIECTKCVNTAGLLRIMTGMRRHETRRYSFMNYAEYECVAV